MTTFAAMLAIPTSETRGVMGRPRHDENPESRRRHVDCALDRLIRKIPVAECMSRYGLRSARTINNYIAYAIEYRDDPMAEAVRMALRAKRSA